MTSIASTISTKGGFSKPTIRNVALDAGVSIATVSGILSKRADCRASADTRARVLATVERLGYRPSRMAHALHGKGTMTVGIVAGLDAVEIWVRTIVAFEKAARDKGYMVLAGCTQNSPELEDRVIEDMLDRHVDALAVYPTETGAHEQLRRLVASGFPIVTFDTSSRLDFQVDDVSIDQFHGGRLQARHLIESGCRRVCLVNGAERCYVNDLKRAGLEAGLAEAGLKLTGSMELKRSWTQWDDPSPNLCDEIRDYLQAHRGEFDALASQGDMFAMLAMRVAMDMGIRVPEDLAVVGFNDIMVAGLMVPPLTTITDPAEDLGRAGLELLLERLTDTPRLREVRHVKIQPRLRIRGSSARTVSPGSGGGSGGGPSR